MEHHPTTPVQVRVQPGTSAEVTVLTVDGPLTLNNFFEFQDLSRQQSSPVLLVDVAAVPYIDSAALGALVGIHVSRDKAKKRYAIVGANDRLEKMFSLTGVASFLVTYPSVSEAEAALLASS